MRRRELISLVGAAAILPASVWAQARRVYRVGYLGTGASNPHILRFFHDGLREFGWVEGQNIIVEHRFGKAAQTRYRGWLTN